jgi:phosphoribosylformylglycinamidine cyclo-ligase
VSTTSYRDAGVREQDAALSAVARHLGPTLSRGPAKSLLGFGHYAAVLQVGPDLGVAVCTDGVGSKTMVAAAVDRYDTIGFDCVAMNVNDIVCVGARPVALLDYLGVHTLDERRADAILRGLGQAAADAGISVPGGEIAQLPGVIGSDGRGPGDPAAFDLVGTCLGTLHPSDLVVGDAIRPGDVLVGVASSGIHANGLTLARRVLAGPGGYGLDVHVADLGRTLGEELLEPTTIYARAVLDLFNRGIATHGLAHVTGGGLRNLLRLNAGAGYLVDDLFEPPAIFDLIRRLGDVSLEEMFAVFNMGVGFVVVVPGDHADDAVAVASEHGHRARRIGTVTEEAGTLRIEPAGLVWRARGGAPH